MPKGDTTYLGDGQARLAHQHLLLLLARIRMTEVVLEPALEQIRHVPRQVPPPPLHAVIAVVFADGVRQDCVRRTRARALAIRAAVGRRGKGGRWSA